LSSYSSEPATAAAAGTSSSGGFFGQLWAVATDGPVKDMLSVMLCRGAASAAGSLMQATLIKGGVLVPASIAQLRLACTVLQVLSSVFIAPRWNNRHCPGWVFRRANAIDMTINVLSVVCFIAVMQVQDAGYFSLYFYCVVCPLSVISSVLGTISFVAVVQQATTCAQRHPQQSAAVITYLYSAANFGYLLPSSACLFASEPVGRLIGVESQSTVAATLAGTSIAAAIVLRAGVLLPAAARMEAMPVAGGSLLSPSAAASPSTPLREQPAESRGAKQTTKSKEE
jgi:hypothetical protein